MVNISSGLKMRKGRSSRKYIKARTLIKNRLFTVKCAIIRAWRHFIQMGLREGDPYVGN